MRKMTLVLGVAVAMPLALTLSGCGDGSDQQHQPAGEIGYVTIEPQRLELTTELVGRTSAVRIAEIRPQVNGIILKRMFEEGANVKAGQQLYQIDPALYKASYDSAVAALAKAQANVKTARAKAGRYKDLVGVNAVSRQDYDDVVATLAQNEADVASAKADVDTARTNLAYTKVYSPIDGRIGKSTVTEGALVTANQTTALATVTQLDPIYVDVTQSSADLLKLKRDIAHGRVEGDEMETPVTLKFDGGDSYGETGKLQFSGVVVDEGTGTVQLRAVFQNPKEELLPGMFVRAVIGQGALPKALLVPQQGVTRNTDGSAVVWLVGPDNKVKQQTVTAARAVGDKWLVTEGLKAGDKVVVEGLQKLTMPGAEPTPVPAGQKAAAARAESNGGTQ
ncbi:MAG TPA: efflux RND transporter periplasmic adaptor subunit [Parvibaculum sp.]|nr:efflux RND transporter periplasmic adaptor subunit [Parvibaculum sp.]